MIVNALCIIFALIVSLLIGGIIVALIDYHFESWRNRELNRRNDYLKRCLQRAELEAKNI